MAYRMKIALILALMAQCASAAGPIPMVILRPNGVSTYAYCEGATCPTPESNRTEYAFPLVLAISSACLIGMYVTVKALTRREGGMIKP